MSPKWNWAGRMLRGTKAQHRIAEHAEHMLVEGFPKLEKAPPGTGEIAKEAKAGKKFGKTEAVAETEAETALKEAVKKLGLSKRAIGNAAEVLERELKAGESLKSALRTELGILPKELEQLSRAEWAELLEHADTLKAAAAKGRKAFDGTVASLKGRMAEVIIQHSADAARLQRELALEVMGDPYWSRDVHFVPRPKTRVKASLAPGDQAGVKMVERLEEAEATDGVFVLFARRPKPGQPRVRVLAVIESKSPSNIRELIEKGKQTGRPRHWAGQIANDLERLSNEELFIHGEWYGSDEIAISRRQNGTRWVIALPEGRTLSEFQVCRLKGQGFSPEVWNLKVKDRDLNKAAEKTLQLLRR